MSGHHKILLKHNKIRNINNEMIKMLHVTFEYDLTLFSDLDSVKLINNNNDKFIEMKSETLK